MAASRQAREFGRRVKTALAYTGKPRSWFAKEVGLPERTAARVLTGTRPLDDEEADALIATFDALGVPEQFFREGFAGADRNVLTELRNLRAVVEERLPPPLAQAADGDGAAGLATQLEDIGDSLARILEQLRAQQPPGDVGPET